MQFFNVLEKNATVTSPLPRCLFQKPGAAAVAAAVAPPWTSLLGKDIPCTDLFNLGSFSQQSDFV